MMTWLLSPPSLDDIVRVLRAWRLWTLGALLGALLGAVVFWAFPPDYRAQATVVVDFDLERAWPQETDRKLYYYLERETRKLVEVAWADETLNFVAQAIGDLTVADLRNERLHLSQPQDGGWHFYADDPDPARADRIASLWAEAFTRQVQRGIENALTLQNLRATLETGAPLDDGLRAEIVALEESSYGITPYAQVYFSQKEDLPIARKIALGEYVALGALSVLLALVFSLLFFQGSEKR